MANDSRIRLQQLKVDGGIATNRFAMQFLVDLLKTDVVTMGIPDISARGGACIAAVSRASTSGPVSKVHGPDFF